MASETSDLFDRWFRIADSDRDGRISGQEAVTFFQRSGLKQETLFKVWKLVAGDNSHLTKAQFWGSLRLVSLAQKRQGQLPEAEARSTLIGVGAALPPPILAGLETEAAVHPSSSPGVSRSGSSASLQFPPLQEHTLQTYARIFSQLDKRGDGNVQGGDCFGTFMQSGLPRQTLKDVWQTVAGDQSYLTRQQFVSCLYLMDLAKQGRPVPSSLPPGPFPPGPGSWSQPPSPAASTRLDLGSVQQVQHDVFSNDLPTPVLPRRAVFPPSTAPPPPSRVPPLEDRKLDSLDPLQRQRLQNDRELAQSQEKELHEAQRKRADAAAKEAFFREALQELTLFKSRTSAALLQAQEQLHSATLEAQGMEGTYQSAWETAQASHTQNTALLQQLSEAKARKAEGKRKLDELQKDIDALDSISGEDVAAETKAVDSLLQEVARLEAEKSQLTQQKEAVFSSRQLLQEKVEQLNQDVGSAAAAIDAAEDELVDLVKKLEAGDDSAAVRLQACMRKSAAMHQKLLGHARRENIAIPETEDDQEETSQQSTADGFLWSQYVLVGAKDWSDSAGQDLELVDNLPTAERLLDPNAAPPKADRDEGDASVQENGHVQHANDVTEEDSWAAF